MSTVHQERHQDKSQVSGRVYGKDNSSREAADEKAYESPCSRSDRGIDVASVPRPEAGDRLWAQLGRVPPSHCLLK